MSDRGARSMENLDAVIWGNLDSALVNVILSFLPVPVLSRYRTVCKKWNLLICSPKFGGEQKAAAAKRRGTRSTLFAMRSSLAVVTTRNLAVEAWSFLEILDKCPERSRWYTVKIPRHPTELVRLDPGMNNWVSAIDGGLVCRYARPGTLITDGDTGLISILVHNPIDGNAERILPSVPRECQQYTTDPVLTLAVDVNTADSQLRFKVFLITQDAYATGITGTSSSEPLLRIYDSETNLWRGSTNPPYLASLGVRLISSTIVFKGYLYVLIDQSFNLALLIDGDVEDDGSLWRYSLEDDVWEEVYLMKLKPFARPFQLFVCANRLFRIGWVYGGRTGKEVLLDMSEINIPEVLVPQRLLSMSEKLVNERFGVLRSRSIAEFTACGMGNSILVVCKSSNTVGVIDLEDLSSWNLLPSNPTWPHPAAYEDYEDYLAKPISSMNDLLLPSYREWC